MTDLAEIMRTAHKEARRLRDVHPLLKAKLPPYRVTLAKALRFAWAAHKRAPVVIQPVTPARAAATEAVFLLQTKDMLTPSDFNKLARLQEAARTAA